MLHIFKGMVHGGYWLNSRVKMDKRRTRYITE